MSSNYYRVLGIPSTATADEIRTAYRRLARLYHPDLHSGSEAEERMQEINRAYATLSDPMQRRQYDIDIAVSQLTRRSNGQSRRTRVITTPQPISRTPQRGEDIELALSITEREAERGARKVIDLVRLDICPRCRGTGWEPEDNIGKSPCWRCAGRQRLYRSVKTHATLPAGSTDGRRLRLRGQGNAGVDGGAQGHAYITVRVQPNGGSGRMLKFMLRHILS